MKRRKTCHRVPVLVIVLLVFFGAAHGQIPDSLFLKLQLQENAIQNAAHLNPFFEKLFALKSGDHPTVNIIHIGDSHVQADFMTTVVRRSLQYEFGNAGRGLVVPARVAGTNEPLNFHSTSSGQWNSKRIIHTTKPLSIGIGGITLYTTQGGATFGMKMNDPEMDYSFNSVTLFYDEDVSSFTISVEDSLANQLFNIVPREKSQAENYVRVLLPSARNTIVFRMMRNSDVQKHATLYGLNFENGQRGVLYHAIGVNGAKYEHFNAADLFAKQTSVLQPDLIVVSLGTNESVQYPNLNRNFSGEVKRLIESLATHNPNAVFVLVTPPDAFLKKVKPNPGIELIRSEIIQYAVENGIAFWDMYKINGGKNSAMEWKMRGLLRPDGIHFSREGYAQQGKLLYEALIKSYQDYVADRHP